MRGGGEKNQRKQADGGGISAAAPLRALLAPPTEALGYELVHVEYAPERGKNVLRIYIDAPGGIRVDDCEAVSRQLSALLDVEQPLALSGAYELEVSSPGLDRPLVAPEHFRRHTGKRARITLNAPRDDGRRRYTGTLLEADEERVVLLVDDAAKCELTYAEMRMARLEPALNAPRGQRA
ncbi:MAG: ribosome maturation factor RimP [Gammaproteobacteria bacterium]|nr:ribosome maturation factor RimP [Gammaproteobacteria bacterium]